MVSEEPEGAGSFREAAVRPYAIMAVAIDPECFSAEQRARTVERALAELVTPAGLRTLSPSHSSYLGRCTQGAEPRDGSSHHGAVWPFLVGFFVRALLGTGPASTLILLGVLFVAAGAGRAYIEIRRRRRGT